MNDLYQSPVLYALGWAIAGSFWQMGLLWLVHQLFFVIPFRQRPGLKHGSAVLLLGAGAAWFLVSFFLRLDKMRELQSYLYRIDSDIQTNPASTGFSVSGIIAEGEKFLPYFSAAYLVVLAFLFFRLVQGLIITQQISNSRQLHPTGQWQHFVDRLCIQLNIQREVMIYLSETINVPATIGFIKPVILLPVATLNNLTIGQAEAIILHEMAHIKRFDYLINIIVSIIETLLFFNPFARLLSLSIRKERELCCDDFVIQYQCDPQCYANALLSLEKSRNALNLAMAATGKESLLLGRVKRILQVPDQPVQYRHHLMALFAVATVIMCMAILNPPKSHIKNNFEYSTLSKQLDGSKLYYSLPTIFNSIRKELPSADIPGKKELIKQKEQRTARVERKYRLKNDLFAGVPYVERMNEQLEKLMQETPPPPENNGFVFYSPTPPAMKAPFIVFDDNKQFVEYPQNYSRSEDKVRQRSPSPEYPQMYNHTEDQVRQKSVSPDVWQGVKKKGGEISPPELLGFNDESIEKFYSLLDLQNVMAKEEKIKTLIAGQAMENMTPRVKVLQNQLLRKKISKDDQEEKQSEADAFLNMKERNRVKPVIRTFSSEDGTVISIKQENGKIEITVKDNR